MAEGSSACEQAKSVFSKLRVAPWFAAEIAQKTQKGEHDAEGDRRRAGVCDGGAIEAGGYGAISPLDCRFNPT